MKHLLLGMFILVVAFPLFVVAAVWFGYAMERGADWLLRNTPVETVMPPLNTTVIYKSDRLACDGRGE